MTDANSVTFILTAATSFVNYSDISGDPRAKCEKIMAGVTGKEFNELKNTHLKDFSSLMGRVHLNIGDSIMNERPTDERLDALRKGLPDPDLLSKIFQFGRYILASTSSAGREPDNHQVQWNEELNPNSRS